MINAINFDATELLLVEGIELPHSANVVNYHK